METITVGLWATNIEPPAASLAIELQTVVCAMGAVGTPPGDPVLDTVVGGAAAFIRARRASAT